MRSLVLVVRREIAANRFLLWAAAAASLLPLVIPLAPGLDRWPYPTVRTAAAITCAAVQTVLLSLALGWSVIGRDLTERRLSFYFSKPISSGAIWIGKFLGAVLIVIASAILMIIPAAVLGWRTMRGIQTLPSLRWWAWLLPLVAFAVCLFLIGLAHTLGIILRSRSTWAVLHFPLLAGAIFYGTTSSKRLAADHAPDALLYSGVGMACLVLIALWAASGTQVCAGRTDLVRGHRVLSWVLWPILSLGLIGFEFYSRWVVDVTAADLDEVSIVGDTNRGTWICVQGRARNRGNNDHLLLFDTATGRSVKTVVEEPNLAIHGPVISRNGNWAAWLQRVSNDGQQAVFVANLNDAFPAPIRTPISALEPTELALSGDGKRIALFQSNLVHIYQLPEGEFLGGTSLRAPDRLDGMVQFLTADRVRAYVLCRGAEPSGRLHLEILEFDTAAGVLEIAGGISGATRAWLPSDPAPRKIVVCGSGQRGGRLELCDARTGEMEKVLVPEGMEGIQNVYFLADGRIVVLSWRERDSARLLVFTSTGEEERVIDLAGEKAWLGAEYAPGRLIVRVSGDSRNSLHLVDLASGEMQPSEASMLPVPVPWWRSRNIRISGSIAPGDLQSRLYWTGTALVQYDPLSGTGRSLIGPARQTWMEGNR